MQTTDDALVKRAREGDLDAFDLLLQRHRSLLLRVCCSMVGEDLADDAAQEASLRAMLHLHTLEQADRFGPWLAGIGLNVCRSWLRARSREFASLVILEGSPSSDPGPEARAEKTDVADRVRHAVDSLPDGQRSAIRLFYLSGLSYAETADALGIRTGSVRTRLYKARTALRCQLRSLSEEETMTDEKDHTCSFCSKPSHEVRRMIAGPKGVIICNQCIDLCNKIIADEEAKTASS